MSTSNVVVHITGKIALEKLLERFSEYRASWLADDSGAHQITPAMIWDAAINDVLDMIRQAYDDEK